MFFKLLLLFTVVPAVELYLLIWLGQHIGAGTTVLIIITTGAVGAALAKREGLGVLRSIQEETLRGVPPGDRLIEGVLVLVGGVLLITPGVLTDLTGILLIMPWTRQRLFIPAVKAYARQRLEAVGVKLGEAAPGPAARAARAERASTADHPTPARSGPDDGFDHPVR
jgi:UPF0716 protein FxsA